MLKTLRNAWKIEDLRKKLIFTMLILVVVRLGSAIPVPFLDPTALKAIFNTGGGNLLGYLDVLTGGALASGTLFALSVSPYITSSIVIQLLTVAIPSLERLAKSGEDGQKKVKKISRYATVGIAALQAFGFYTLFRNGYGAVKYVDGWAGFLAAVTIISAFTAGSLIVVWLGERIDAKGIGNGISLILFVGIVSSAPSAIINIVVESLAKGWVGYIIMPIIAVIFVALITFIILMNNAERRIPIQYAKRVVGRKMYGGQSSFMPIKVNMSGVLPVIFAGTILSIPSTIGAFISAAPDSFMGQLMNAFAYNSPIYAVLYFLLIIAFNYFYIAIQYNPIEMANNLRKNNGAIPGIRPGKPTTDFITKVISKVTLVGALMLAFIAILPILVGAVTGMNIALGGTSVIILVGVALDTSRNLESQMMMRHYKGFLE